MSGTITLGTTDGTTYRKPASTATEKAVPLDLLLADGARWAVWGSRSQPSPLPATMQDPAV